MAVTFSWGCGCNIFEQNCMEDDPLDLDLHEYNYFYSVAAADSVERNFFCCTIEGLTLLVTADQPNYYLRSNL
jgi:hypothetical protein